MEELISSIRNTYILVRGNKYLVDLFEDKTRIYIQGYHHRLMVKTERNRYIVFEVKTLSSISRRDVITEFQRGNPVKPWLVIFEGRRGIVRCTHTQKEQIITYLNSLKSIAEKPVKIVTVVTSGTLRCAKERLAKT